MLSRESVREELLRQALNDGEVTVNDGTVEVTLTWKGSETAED